jgi:TolB-like protein
MNLFSELRNRNVIRGAIAYAALAWLVIEVGSVVLPAFGAPEWALRGLIILLAVGFIPALVLIWRYEWTPEGVMTESDAEAARTDSRFRSRRIDVAIIAVLGVALALLITERLTLDSREVVSTAVGLAVLPFDSLSASDEDGYIAAGMHEELLSHLARIGDLRLISSSSMMRIAQSGLTVPEMGQRLSVSHVLEGSLRREGDRVRISVQLIEAETDQHVWAENFERSLGDLFALQSDVALAIAAQLSRALSTEAIAAITETPTTDPRAYRLFLQVIDEFRSSRHGGDPEVIEGLLEQALALDPDFLQAKVLLAGVLGRSHEPGSDERALRLVTEIRQRWPNHVLAQRALGHYRYAVEHDYVGALEAYQAVVAELPNDIVAVVNVRNAYKRVDQREEFLYWSQRAVELSPESQVVADEHVRALEANQRRQEAVEFIEASAERFTENESWKIDAIQSKLDLFGDVESYLQAGEELRAEGGWAELEDLSWIYYSRGDLDLALAHLEARRGEDYNDQSVLADMDGAQILRLEGRDEEAQALAERAYSDLAPIVDQVLSRGSWQTKRLILWVAQAAAIAQMTEEAARLQTLADQQKRDPYFWIEALADVENAYLDAYLGDPEAGWKRLEPWADDPTVFATRAYLRVSPLHQHLFGEVPRFQEFINSED